MATRPSTSKGDGEQRRGTPRRGLISGQTFKNREVTYSPVDGDAIFEGDIILGSTADLEANLQRGKTPELVAHGVGIVGFRWPKGIVPFQIAAALPNPKRVRDAIAHWESKTAIRFVERTGANANQLKNYVEFVPASGCSSSVGMQGGRQLVKLGTECTMGNVVHEIGHTIGLWHEQSREDRDQFIEIIWANIDSQMKHNFDQHIQDGDDLGTYDYGSIMHYPKTAFSVNGQETIRPKQANAAIGQRQALSAGDVSSVHDMYPTLGNAVTAPATPSPAKRPGGPKTTTKSRPRAGSSRKTAKRAKKRAPIKRGKTTVKSKKSTKRRGGR